MDVKILQQVVKKLETADQKTDHIIDILDKNQAVILPKKPTGTKFKRHQKTSQEYASEYMNSLIKYHASRTKK